MAEEKVFTPIALLTPISCPLLHSYHNDVADPHHPGQKGTQADNPDQKADIPVNNISNCLQSFHIDTSQGKFICGLYTLWRAFKTAFTWGSRVLMLNFFIGNNTDQMHNGPRIRICCITLYGIAISPRHPFR